MGEANQDIYIDPKKVLIILGALIFGGLLLVSFIHANFYAEKYSSAFLWQFRGTIVGAGIIYFALTFIMNRN
ncbi:hypothetical protein [Bacillus sp. JCM 19034]|uniref:hypothetical protein n=1 Tax=Bacillus sp. JCM 19034 TaxID=1481928 RepID=UPI00078654BA|nr:hypothetical protein [Bacillus sp. JCM 19034]